MALYPIKPIAKPRMTRADKWKNPPRSSVAIYRAFCDECRLRMGRLDLNYKDVTWYIPMPASWSEKKKKEHVGNPHLSKPDLSNLLKALEDALYSDRYTGRDDKEVHTIGRISKVWSRTPGIEIQ